jgi:hypothetical protein
MYKATFNPDGTRITSYVEGLHTDIPADAIEISDEDQELYATNQYKRGSDGKPVKIPPHIPTTDELLTTIRAKRNNLLTDCDWTDTLSAKTRLGIKYNEWQTYRQALRDFPATCDPENPVWPVKPE